MITKSIKELHEDLLNKKVTSKEIMDILKRAYRWIIRKMS